MGNYVFTADALRDAVTRDAAAEASKHDMGGNIVPWFVERSESAVYDFKDNDVPGSYVRDRDYWRDVGTMQSYYDAHMDLVAPLPEFNLYNSAWPIFTSYGALPPAKLVEGELGKAIETHNSILSPGVVITGGNVKSRCSPRRAGSGRGRRSRTPCCSTESQSAPGPWFEMQSSTRTSMCLRAPRSAST